MLRCFVGRLPVPVEPIQAAVSFRITTVTSLACGRVIGCRGGAALTPGTALSRYRTGLWGLAGREDQTAQSRCSAQSVRQWCQSAEKRCACL